MEKINNIAAIEQIVYEKQLNPEDEVKSLRFVSIIYGGKSQSEFKEFFYYDCLLACIILINNNEIYKWNSHALKTKDFPLYKKSNVTVDNKPKFQKKEWFLSVENAKSICLFLEKKLFDKSLDAAVINDLHICIANIKQYFCLDPINPFTGNHVESISYLKNKDIDCSTIPENNFIIVENFYTTLSSPKLFQELNFGEKHTNKVYLLLEKIFYNFSILSKYKIEQVYEKVTKIDQYLVNHMKNIYLSQDFSMIDIQEETVSILAKINTYLTQEIDNYLEECIDNQLSIIDSIHNKFTRVNQT